MKEKILLQLFADGAGAAGGEGSGAATTGVTGASPVAQGEDTSTTIYGVSNQNVADSKEGADTNVPTEDKSKVFENMIKKGGEYAEEFNKRTQQIIDKRFKETKTLESKLQETSDIMSTLAMKYGLKDASDIAAISKAIADDESYYEEAAFKEGLTTQQYKDKLKLERENAQLKAAEEQRRAQEHADAIYAKWTSDAANMAEKYGMTGFDFEAEINSNPELVDLLGHGIEFETAYKATHVDDLLGGAMAATATNVTKAMAQRVATRNSRPSENGLVSSNTNTMKPDVSKLTKADLQEVWKRVEQGELISFGNTMR